MPRSAANQNGGGKALVPGLDPASPYVSRLSARSALFTELHLLLDREHSALSSGDYRALVVTENKLSRSSSSARTKLWKELKGRYRLDAADPLFAAFWTEWQRCVAEAERGLTAYVLLALNDHLVADLGTAFLFPLMRRAPAELRVVDVLAFIERAATPHTEVKSWSENTRRSLAQDYCASIRDFGLAKGIARKTTVRPALYGSPVRLLVRALRLSGKAPVDLVRAPAFRLLGLDGIEVSLPPGSIYTVGSDATDARLALFLLQTQMNRGSGRIIPLGNLSSKMKEAIKTADAYLKANLKNLGIDHDLKAYDFTVQAINLNQAKEGSETAVAFFISLVSAILEKPVLDRTVVIGEMSVQGMLLKVASLSERMQLAVESGAKRILIPIENKRDLADIPDSVLTATQWQFYDSPTMAAIMAMGMG